MYLMISKYLVSPDEVAKVRSRHLAFLEGLNERGVLVAAGRQDPPVGGVVLLDVGDEALGHQILADDPYVLNGIAEYTAVGWHPTVGALADFGKQQS